MPERGAQAATTQMGRMGAEDPMLPLSGLPSGTEGLRLIAGGGA